MKHLMGVIIALLIPATAMAKGECKGNAFATYACGCLERTAPRIG